MKKLTLSLLASTVVLAACGNANTTTNTDTKCDTLNVFNATEYMKEEVYKKFASDNNIKIVYDTFESNEAMYTKLSSGVTTYDVIIPSDYMIQNLIEKGLLQKLNKDLIPNAKGFFESISKPEYDMNQEYSLPYMWGTVGLAYNKNAVSVEDLDSQGWAILKNPKYADQIYAYDSERDGFMPALKNLGYSLNTADKGEIDKAVAWLQDMNEKTKPVFVTDQVQDGMIAGEKNIAVLYSGDANLIISENEDVAYYTPKEGTNLWVDAMVVPKNAKCPELAHKFINYLLDPEVMKENAIEIGYTPSLQAVAEDLAKNEYPNIETYIPETRANDEIFKHNEETKKILSELWLKVKVK